MSVVISNRDKLTKSWFWRILALAILLPAFWSIISVSLKFGQRDGIINIFSIEDFILFGIFIVSLLMYPYCLVELCGKEKWTLEDNAICVAFSVFGIVFNKRKWVLSNILDVQYAHIPANSFILKPSVFSFGVYSTISHDAYYEIYFRLADKRKSIRVLWSGLPEPVEKVYAFIKGCQIDKAFEC